MAIEAVPLPAPPSVDSAKFSPDFGREVKGVKPGELTEEQFKEVQQLLYKVRNTFTCLYAPSHSITDQHGALLFRDADLSPEQQYALTKARFY